jgi:RHS repeat-associated protein
MRTLKLIVAVIALCLGAAALSAEPRVPRAELAKYVLVLWAPGSPIPAEGVPGTIDVPPPDIGSLGGRVLAANGNRRIILLPPAAARQLRQHEAVVFLQRLWNGESTEDWDESYPEPPRSRLQSDGTPSEWGPKNYTYDGSGNIRQIGNDQYTYDTAGRLISATVNGKSETFQYDAFGNLVQKGVAGSNPVVIPVDPASNRLVGPEYDAAGNVISRTGRGSYAFDSFNMMTGVRASVGGGRRMIYDPNDERIGTLIDSALSRWTIRDLEGQVIREYKADHGPDDRMYWFWEQDHFHGGGALVGGETQEWGYTAGYRYGGPRHYHLDHLGSVRMVTNAAGRSLSEHEYYPFGVTQTPTYQEQINWGDPHVDSMRFAGHARDFLGLLNVDNNEYLDYMHARYYDPNLGRFLSVDPAPHSVSPSEPQTWNRYTYALNNPVNVVDPSGAVPCDAQLPGGHIPEGDCEQAEATDPETEKAEERMRRLNAWLLSGVIHASNAAAGMGDTLSLGLTAKVRDLTGANEVVDQCSGMYNFGEALGVGTSLALGGASAARGALAMGGRSGSLATRLARGLRRFGSDSRRYSSVSRQYWGARGGAGGKHLHHWGIPQRAGGPSAGWNLMELPGGLNSWMGYSGAGRVVEGAIRAGVPGSLAAGAYLGVEQGLEKAESPCE